MSRIYCCFFFFLITCSFSSSLCAQEISFSGCIIDQDTGEGLAYAHLLVKYNGHGTITDELGYFRFIINHGDSIQVSMIGYESKVIVGGLENEKIALMPLEELLQNVTILANYETYKVGGSKPRSCLLYTSPSPRDQRGSRMPSSA